MFNVGCSMFDVHFHIKGSSFTPVLPERRTGDYWDGPVLPLRESDGKRAFERNAFTVQPSVVEGIF